MMTSVQLLGQLHAGGVGRGELMRKHLFEAVTGRDGLGGIEPEFESPGPDRELEPLTRRIRRDVVRAFHRVAQLKRRTVLGGQHQLASSTELWHAVRSRLAGEFAPSFGKPEV